MLDGIEEKDQVHSFRNLGIIKHEIVIKFVWDGFQIIDFAIFFIHVDIITEEEVREFVYFPVKFECFTQIIAE